MDRDGQPSQGLGNLTNSCDLPYNQAMITRRGVDASVPLEERERVGTDLKSAAPASSVLLATCDRVELYEGSGEPEPEVVRHLFRVVSGLESPLLGEHQIQGQVKRAYQEAQESGPLDPGLHRLFQQALRVGKRVRSETALGQGALGHAHTVVTLLRRLPVSLEQLRILVIGVNRLNRGILRFLARRGQGTVFLGNRSLQKAQDLVADLGTGEALSLEALPEVLGRVDVVISATSAPHLIVHEAQLPLVGGPRWFFDLAVPRDIDPAVASRPGCQLYNVTDLEEVATQSLRNRRSEVVRAEAIVDQETVEYFA